jgi:anhydro-N-acetylmuramic acid kinase
MNGSRLVVGAMSGTSADGVDAALVRVEGRGTAMTATLLAHQPSPYPAELRQAIYRVREGAGGGGGAGAGGHRGEPLRLEDLARLARGIALAYADAVRRLLAGANVAPARRRGRRGARPDAVPRPADTIQWIDAPRLAAEVGCPVVSDFRQADCAAGGQGAPLVPFADYVLFRSPTKTRVLLNLGGIANITYLRAGGTIDDVVAFDTGPANCISDALVRAVDPAGAGVDPGGAIAARGVPVFPLVQHVLADAYFAKPPPKSTDVPAMVSCSTRPAPPSVEITRSSTSCGPRACSPPRRWPTRSAGAATRSPTS